MSSTNNRLAVLVPVLCVLAMTAVSCKSSSGLEQLAPPTAESLTLAVCEYFENNGYDQDDTGVFHSETEDFVLYRMPAHVIRVDCDKYPFQGIMTRKATLKKEHNAEVVYFVIMWWSADEGKWVHLTGRDIPHPQYGLQQ